MQNSIWCGAFSFALALALAPTGASAQVSQKVVRDALNRCQAGDAKACEEFADGANFGLHEDIGKFALPGAIEAMHPLCESHHDGGWTSYCHAEENIQAYIAAKANPTATRAAALQSKMMGCIESSTNSRRVYTGQMTGFGPAYDVTYDSNLKNTCNFTVIVKISEGESMRSTDEITMGPGETYSGSSVRVESVRRVAR